MTSDPAPPVEPDPEATRNEEPAEWAAVPYREPAEGFGPFGDGTPADPPAEEGGGRRLWLWLGVGAALQALAVLGWVYLIA